MRGSGRVFDRPRGSGRNWAIAYFNRGQEHREAAAKALGKAPELIGRPDAERLLRARLRAIARGHFTTPASDRLTVGEVLDGYLKAQVLEESKALPSLRSHVGRVREAFAEVRVSELTTAAIQDWIQRSLDSGLARGTLKVYAAYLRAALRWAERAELVPRIPYVPSLRVDNARQGFFERAEFERVHARLPKPVDDIALFAYLTGWRKEEILGLTWAMVDHRERLIRLPDSKNGDGRVLPLVGPLWDLIGRRWQGRVVDGTQIVQHVFHRHGKPVRDFRLVWRRACAEAGVPGRYLHDCRRTAARNMIAAGVHESAAMKITGHRSRSMFERYNIVGTREIEAALVRRMEHEHA